MIVREEKSTACSDQLAELTV